MSRTLPRWNQLPLEDAAREIVSCCGSEKWAWELAGRRPFTDQRSLVASSDEIWNRLNVSDWMEAFSTHPRIGERKMPQAGSRQSAAWSSEEQRAVAEAESKTLEALALANEEYEKRFGRVFIVCATGKSAAEMLEILQYRLGSDEETEIRVAAEEQRKITNIRLEKWLAQ
ncbi:MAG TPA: 2-oxo-4-hydroxy-4-carboxy-5-ureidoimidazoline decarboxylase [Candidatus Solibacter sp.]|nr:2-oxo-4-hydroxy-4-carboxy-5-ureidoimidazoline decarboxylase [Candidatus Solibacter sp.]